MAKPNPKPAVQRNPTVAPPSEPPVAAAPSQPDNVGADRAEIERLTEALRVANETIAQLRAALPDPNVKNAAPSDDIRGVLIECPLVDESNMVPIRQIEITRRSAGVFARLASGLLKDEAHLSSGQAVCDIRSTFEWIADQLSIRSHLKRPLAPKV